MLLNNKSITRISFEKKLVPLLKVIPAGVVLDVGAKNSPYRRYLPHTKFIRLDISAKNKPDIICDLHKIRLEDDCVDTVLATEVFEHLHSPELAAKELRRVLIPGGALVISTRFIFPYHADPQDYYRFTTDALKYLLRQFSRVKVYPHGNRLQAIWQLMTFGRLANILAPLNPLVAKVNYPDNDCPLGFIVIAKK